MALALYRRYRPDTFEGVIGQDQVTVPLMRALDEGKLTHAYLFSGPRGCGKTSSARILARCVNCAKGPTSHPCGECESCKDLATGGPGSIDVVEIDAASHNGVDDARELRERAGFAPARDRYKIFILDEAHMVTQQGFNALLKIVEEPPEHVMFIFATTEPDKVIGTIRSRTHHYPFRLVPQEVMGPYLEKICVKEGIKPEPGVLKLAMRAGGGSMRDTLSVLDQLMVGSVEGVITHDAAVALLGFTPEALIGEAIDAVIDHNGEALYGVIQKVVVGGFDPRRFVEDLLARVRDLLVLTLAGASAEAVLSDMAEAEDMDDLHRQAAALGLGPLTAMADIINATLSSMTGAISPRMRLELLAARLLAGAESGFALTASVAPTAGAPANVPAAGAATGSGAQHHAASGGFVGASRNAANNAPAQNAPRGGFAGASQSAPQSGFADAARNRVQQSMAAQAVSPIPQPTAQPSGPANASDWAGAANVSQPAPVTSAPVNDTRSVDEKWDAAVAKLPETIREYVTRAKVPTVKFGTNRKGLPCLSLTFDQSLSQHAFALAVDSNGKKAAIVVQDAVRNEFGLTTVIAPTAVAANGERVESIKRMSPEQLAKVKQQIALAKAGLAAANLGSGLTVTHAGSEPKGQKAAAANASSEDADDSHRAAAQLPDDDPWAKPAPAASEVKTAASAISATDTALSPHEEHHKKHVAVPDVSDGIDPWAQPTQVAQPEQAAQAVTQQPAGQATSSVPAQETDPWSQPSPAATVENDPWNQPQPAQPSAPDNDPWNQPQTQQSAGPSGWEQAQEAQAHQQAQPQQPQSAWEMPQDAYAPEPDPWNQPVPEAVQPQHSAQPAPQVDPDEDEYSMSDQSLGDSRAMSLDDLKKMFEVKDVKEFAADDPKNPKNAQPAKKHIGE
ncbi:DNA polymerase III subunit gamma and tau [Bifidobacterium felsineum]|uniref:DNA-directed DNA polymerase n=1 Tax=Bifidobacterium felsineum TaxID=2045440 RepID=A0A2M9HLH2_9BIFI|nr:DNA polymerase III subunit gamma and tau [Bifidobacterium felsineum]PJM77665.1 DNA polymerase III subunit gamma/tau [Bifidobacterium felsineum]